MISKVNKIDNSMQTAFKAGAKKESAIKNAELKTKVRKFLPYALAGLSVLGVAAIALSSKKKVSLEPVKDTLNKAAASFKGGLAYDEKGGLYTGSLIKTNPLGEKFSIEIKDGVIQQSTKTTPDGEIAFVKKYSTDEYQNKVTDIFIPKEDGELGQAKRILTSKDKIAIFRGENEVEQFWYKTPDGFKRVDEFIDKSDIECPMSPEGYYEYNGIQINAFLRDGEFRHPDIRMDKIHYEILDDPTCPEYAKEDIRQIMKDNRFILSAIDDLDIETQTSVTDAPMTVFRNAPKRWVKSAQDGILTERAFCSTSTVKGASMEGLYVGKDAKDGVTYTIHLPKGTKFLDRTYTNEKEMLLPRDARFRVINDTELEYIL